VTVQVQEENQSARVSVHDGGSGMPAAEQSRLWDRFYRGKGSAERAGTGSEFRIRLPTISARASSVARLAVLFAFQQYTEICV
jgi:signal transduction histidine kinase